MEYYNHDELYHYGVKGMKWGVRRDIRVLANHRRNTAVRDARDRRAVGEITRKEKRTLIRDANKAKKADIKSMNKDLKNAKNRKEFGKIKHEIAKQTISEVPNHRLKKGATTVNRTLSTFHKIEGVAGLGMAALSGAAIAAGGPATLGLGLGMGGALAVNSAGSVIAHKVIQTGLDRLA